MSWRLISFILIYDIDILRTTRAHQGASEEFDEVARKQKFLINNEKLSMW